MKKHLLKFSVRCVYTAIIIILFAWITHGIIGPQPKTHTELKESISKLEANQPVETNKRLHVVNFFSRRFSGKRAELLGFDPRPVLEKIRNGEELDERDKHYLREMGSRCSDLQPHN